MTKLSMVPSEQHINEAFKDFKHVITMREASLEFRMPERRIRYAYEAGYIVSMNVGRFVLLSRSSLLEWLDKVKRS